MAIPSVSVRNLSGLPFKLFLIGIEFNKLILYP